MSVVAAAVIGSAAIGAISSNRASGRAADAQNQATAVQEDATNRQLDMAEQQWNRYLNTFGPLEDEVVQRSRDYGSSANREKAAEEAAGDVKSSYAGLRQQLNNTPGLDPSSQKYLDTVAKIGLTEAGQSAAAQTGARRQVDVTGDAMMKDAVSIGKGLPGNSAASLGGASASAAALGQSADRAAGRADQQGYSVGRMFGDTLTDPRVIKSIGGLFAPTPVPDVLPGGFNANGTAFNNLSAYVPPGG